MPKGIYKHKKRAPFTKEHRENMSKAIKIAWTKYSPEKREKIRQAFSLRKHTEEDKKKMREIWYNYHESKWSKERREKMQKVFKGRTKKAKVRRKIKENKEKKIQVKPTISTLIFKGEPMSIDQSKKFVKTFI